MPENSNQEPKRNIEFKPNIYPVMYWALAYGVIAGMLLFLVNILSQYIGVIWFPVFLAGVVWGGYRNYKKQRSAWSVNHGISLAPQSPLNEFKQAAQDIIGASREMIAEQAAEDAEITRQQAEEQYMQEQEMLDMQEPPASQPEPTPQPQADNPNMTRQPPPNVPPAQQGPPPESAPPNATDNNRPPQEPN